MIDLEQFKTLNPVDVSDEKMKYFKDELLKMHEELTDIWTEELKKLDNENFDPYSFSNERKLKKLAKKHSPKLAEVDMLLDVIDDELSRRDKYNEQQRYVEGVNYRQDELSDEEYFNEEVKKTERIRKIHED